MSEKKKTTTSGIEIKEVYTKPSAMNELPGEFPFTRGIRKDMYRGKTWTMRQYAGFSTAEESNLRYINCWGRELRGYRWPLIYLLK